MSMPSLWCSLSVKISRHGSIPHLDLIPTWLSRAGGHPLVISMALDRRPGAHVYMTTDAALHSLISSFPTWKQVYFNVGTFLNLPSLLRLPDAQAPSFESLCLHLPAAYEEAAEQLALIFERSPNLSHLTLSAEVPQRDILNLEVPFGSLTALDIPTSMFSSDNSWEILAYCPKLVNLRYGHLSGDFIRKRQGPPITLQNLETLDLGGTGKPMSVFIDAFTAPSLHKLELDFSRQFPARSFVSFLDRSKCPLQTLKLYANMTAAEAICCLKACPLTLAVLSIYGDFVTDLVLERLTAGVPDSLCPQLQTISLGGWLTPLSEGVLATMLESRCLPRDSQDSCLESVTIYGVGESEISRLGELRRQGLKIEHHSFSFW